MWESSMYLLPKVSKEAEMLERLKKYIRLKGADENGTD